MKKTVLYLTEKEQKGRLLQFQSQELWNLTFVLNYNEAAKLAQQNRYDLILVDNKISYYEQFIQSEYFKILNNSVFLLTNKMPTTGNAIFIEEPYIFEDLHKLIQNKVAVHHSEKNSLCTELLGNSNEIQQLRTFIKKSAQQNFPIMLYGESGVGKGLVAEIIHKQSARKDKQFLPINVNTIPDTIAESILFGTQKGAFTDSKDSIGIFEKANGGTIFLDEIESLDLKIQAKLLHVLETKNITRLGSTTPVKCDFRIICASNELLNGLVGKKQFRKDLFYRLDVLRYTIPPLRNHKEDISLLTTKYLENHKKHISKTALNKLNLHFWPGNIRELQNCLARAVCYSENNKTITDDDILF